MGMKKKNRIIFVLSLLGVIMAIYVLQSFLRNTGIVCVTNGCEVVRKNPASWPFGIPVPAVGLVGYSFLMVLSFFRTMNSKLETKLLPPMLGMATFGALFVSWFTYTEIVVIKGICTWCLLSTINMYTIFILLIIKDKLPRKRK